MTVLAEDALQRARMARRSRTPSRQVARRRRARHRRRPGPARRSSPGSTRPVGTWAQLNESDLAFLRRLLARFDADLQVVGTELHVSPRGDVRRGALELELDSQLAKACIRVDLADQVTAITTRGWNAADGKAVSGKASGLTQGGPGQGRDGAALLSQMLGARSEHLGHVAVATDAEAQAVAEAAFDLRARRLVTLEGVTEGNAQLRVGAHCRITGVDHRVREHLLRGPRLPSLRRARQGYRSEFRAECAYLGDD